MPACRTHLCHRHSLLSTPQKKVSLPSLTPLAPPPATQALEFLVVPNFSHLFQNTNAPHSTMMRGSQGGPLKMAL